MMSNKVSHNKTLTDFTTWVQTRQIHIEQVLERVLPDANTEPRQLHSAMRYSVLGGGKRVRALLCYAAAALCHTETKIADAAASAVELIHAYSLVHDDMPCMDDDDVRRGKPSCHKQYDNATALLVGDALQSLAFEILSQPALCPSAPQQLSMLAILSKASGSQGMAGGQAIDLASVGINLCQPALEKMHQLKTGALIEAAVLMGAIQGTDEQIIALRRYAQQIGLAFQVVDDVLDVEASSATLGKTAGKDAVNHKPTYVTLLGLDAAKQYAQHLYESTLTVLAPLGENAQYLRELATLVTQRSF